MKKHGFDVVLVRVDPRDPEQVLQGLLEVLSREKAVSPLLERFTYERMAERMRGMFDENFACVSNGAWKAA